MEWVITQDHLAKDLGAFDHTGYHRLKPATVSSITHTPNGEFIGDKLGQPTIAAAINYSVNLPYEFELLDGDDVVYYSGKCGDITQAYEDEAFEPLDWAMHNDSCVTMMYRRAGQTEWQML